MDEDELLGILRNVERLRALANTELLDSPREERFDRYTRLAREVLHAPMALVSLVDDKRQFFKSAAGFDESVRETPLSHSFCKYTVALGQALIIEDASDHPLVRDSPVLTETEVRAYAGVPLESAGHGIGVLCVADTKPRVWTQNEIASLQALASAVTAEIELSRAKREAEELRALLNALTGSTLDVIITANGAGEILFCNEAIEQVFGYPRESFQGRSVTDLMPERYRQAHRDGLSRVNAGGETHVIGRVVELHGLRKNGEEFPLELSLSRWNGRSEAFYTAVLRDISDRTRVMTALRQAEEQLRLTIDNAAIGIALVALDGRWLRVNEALCRIVGYSREELLAIDFQAITHPDDLEIDLGLVQRVLAGEIPTYTLEKRYLHRDGQVVWVSLAVSLVRTENGEPSFFVSQIQDVSGRVEAERKTSEQAAVLRAVIGSMGDLVMVCDRDGRVAVLNDVAQRLFGPFIEGGLQGRWDPGYGLFLSDKVTRCDPHDFPLFRALRGESVEQCELWVRMPGWPEGRWHSVTANPVRDGDGTLLGAVNVGRDVTTRKELEEQVRQASLVDELTSLQNRRGFMLLGEQLLAVAARYQRSLFVLFADLNGLKRVNDELGHDAGDQAIVDMANVLRRTFRKADVIARLGGDEFVVLAEGDASVAAALKERLNKNINAHNEAMQHPYELSASIGIAQYDNAQATGLAELVSAADKLMYDAKRKMKTSTPQS